jgi:hypothetical protein
VNYGDVRFSIGPNIELGDPNDTPPATSTSPCEANSLHLDDAAIGVMGELTVPVMDGPDTGMQAREDDPPGWVHQPVAHPLSQKLYVGTKRANGVVLPPACARRADAPSAASPCRSPGRQGCMYSPPAVDLSPATAGGFVPPVLPITAQKVPSAQEVLGASGNSTSARSMRRQPAHRTIAMSRRVGSEPAREGV